MERKEILKRIEDIREELAKDQFEIMCEKIMEKKFHLHRSDRKFFVKKIIEKFRKRWILELELILEPILENQKQINMRFLVEIDRLKNECLSQKSKFSHKEKEDKD